MSTPVTVTNPIRGSLRSPIASESDLAHRLVHPPHPLAHSTVTTSRAARDELELLSVQIALGPVEQLLESRRSSRATQATVRPARCQSSWWSTSATEAPKRFWSCAFADCTNLRLPLSDPASGKWSSTARIPT